VRTAELFLRGERKTQGDRSRVRGIINLKMKLPNEAKSAPWMFNYYFERIGNSSLMDFSRQRSASMLRQGVNT
jgi:hypothetical protein